MLLQEVKEKTEGIFGEKLIVPEPAFHWKDKIEALEVAGLTSHRVDAIFDMRCEQASKMGFERMTSGELVEMLMGESYTKEVTGKERQNHEWIYNHHTGETETKGCTWGSAPVDFVRIEKANKWYLPPFCTEQKWSCRFGRLNHLKRTIPYGVVLRINEVKELNLFNAFNVIAPVEAWERKTDIDPIVVATIWSIEKKPEGGSSAGQVAHYFLAQW